FPDPQRGQAGGQGVNALPQLPVSQGFPGAAVNNGHGVSKELSVFLQNLNQAHFPHIFSSIIFFSCPHSGSKMPWGMSFKSGEMRGRTSICASTSFSRSTPGAISIKVISPFSRVKTARSVMYRTDWLTWAAYRPLKVTCSTRSTNFLFFPSCRMFNRPSFTSTFNPLAVKVPQYTTF